MPIRYGDSGCNLRASRKCAGIKMSQLMSPAFVLSFELVFVLIVWMLFASGMIDSFRVSRYGLNGAGSFVVISVWSLCCLALCVLGCVGKKRDAQCITPSRTPRRTILIVKLAMMLSLVAVGAMLVLLLHKYDLRNMIELSLSGGIKRDPVLESFPFFAFSVPPLVVAPLIVLVKEHMRHPYFYCILGCFISLVFALIYASRIVLIEYLLFIAVAIVRKKYFEVSFKASSILCVALAVLSALVITSAARDYEAMGRYYTDSPVVWGIARNIDYPLSAFQYSSYFAEYGEGTWSIESTIPTLGRFKDGTEIHGDNKEWKDKANYRDIGASEYTNKGGLGDVFQYGNSIIDCVVLSLYVFACVLVWRSFFMGKLLGFILYPVVLYSVIEFWRYAAFLTEVPQLVFVGGCAVYLFIRIEYLPERNSSLIGIGVNHERQ